MMPRERCRARDGFTLVEMLVVIAIIGVLAGFLLPALLGAKERGYSVYCQNNLKQLATAMRKYNMLYDGCFPDICDGPFFGYREYPVEYMARMMGLITRPFSDGSPAPKVVLCPSCKITPADGEDYLARHYAVNGHLDSWRHPNGMDYETRVNAYSSFPRSPWNDSPSRQWGGWANFQPYKVDYVKAQDRVAVFADSVDEVDPYAQVWWYPYYFRICATVCYACRPTRHRGGGNVVFLDGHVEWKSHDYLKNIYIQYQWLIDPDTRNANAWWDSNFGK